MTDREFDILVIGATGFTGRLVVEYLSTHKQVASLRIALGGRTLSKIKELVFEHETFKPIYVDVDDESSVLAAVAKTKVVINLAGPYWPKGSVVVRACARHGVHYVDLAGEPHWQAEIIDQYDYLAHKTGACIVPCSGFDSIPSDLASFLATQALEKKVSSSTASGFLHISSISAFRGKGGVSGGTVATMFNHLENVPKEKWAAGSGWSLSPVPAPAGFSNIPRLLYSLPRLRPATYGCFSPMASVNEPVVRRSWGLYEKHRHETFAKSSKACPKRTFSYVEFVATPGALLGILISLFIFVILGSLVMLRPVRWIAKKILPKPGEGPSEEVLKSGWFEIVNVTEAGGVGAKSVIKGNGDPGYALTSIMITECALLLLDPSNLTALAREGGILTPATAFGEQLAHALTATGRFEISSELLTDEESKKTR